MMPSWGPQDEGTPGCRDFMAEEISSRHVCCVAAPAARAPSTSRGFCPSHDRFLIHAPDHPAMEDSRQFVAKFRPDLMKSIPCLPPRSSAVGELPQSTQRLWLSGALLLDFVGREPGSGWGPNRSDSGRERTQRDCSFTANELLWWRGRRCISYHLPSQQVPWPRYDSTLFRTERRRK